MSAERYREALEAWNARDVERFLEFCHPEIEYRSLFTGVEGGSYRGHDGVRQYFADVAETLRDARLEIERVEERGAWVVASGRTAATGAASGAPLDWPFAQAARFQDGLCIFCVSERTHAAALAAAGLA